MIRKADHLRINLEDDVQSGVSAGFEEWRFLPRALPEIDLEVVSTETEVFGRRLRAPLLVSCMTGGTPEAAEVNQVLARAAQEHHVAIGLGSGRALLENPDLLPTFDIRDLAPDVVLMANLGAVQLKLGVTPDACTRLVELLRADALVLHLNALQEALQVGGDVAFGGLLAQIEAACRQLTVPLLVKEVGWGIPADDVRRLLDAGVAGVDIAGAGGTSWSEVERRRSDGHLAAVAAEFRDWGLPTARAVREARAVAPDALIVASGGIHNGMEVAKAIALGADLAGMAGPVLRAAATGEAALSAFISEVVDVVRIVMFCTGCATITELRGITRLEPVGGTSA
ncbi:MAG: isopentenyl-diphosphate Delta-isomerase [Chloroflexota bacterium]|nr:isopentenyl-diphosphate Delta-isomerase [Chloroflexota bacterium]